MMKRRISVLDGCYQNFTRKYKQAQRNSQAISLTILNNIGLNQKFKNNITVKELLQLLSANALVKISHIEL